MNPDPELPEADCRWLLALARRTLQNLDHCRNPKELRERVLTHPVPESAAEKSGVFVTLHAGKNLRGCIGYVLAVEPLCEAVIENTINAALRDPRFPPIEPGEVPDLRIEISVMTPPRAIASLDEIEVGKHGLIITKGWARGLLLPQVAIEHKWDRETFLAQTCRKAGLPMDNWRDEDTQIEIFSAQVFSE